MEEEQEEESKKTMNLTLPPLPLYTYIAMEVGFVKMDRQDI